MDSITYFDYGLYKKVIEFYDPNKSKNKKTNILNLAYSINIQPENKYNITSNRNDADGLYDLILYECPKNKTYLKSTIDHKSLFYNVLSKSGHLIIKSQDFINTSGLHGSFEIINSLDEFNIVFNINVINKTIDNIKHFNLLVFRKNLCQLH